jgi:hypothetical protein
MLYTRLMATFVLGGGGGVAFPTYRDQRGHASFRPLISGMPYPPMILPPTQGVSLHKILSYWVCGWKTWLRMDTCKAEILFLYMWKKSLKLGNWTQLINICKKLQGCVILDLVPWAAGQGRSRGLFLPCKAAKQSQQKKLWAYCEWVRWV